MSLKSGSMLNKENNLKQYRIIFISLLGIPAFLLMDSPYGDKLLMGYGQQFATLVALLLFIAAYQRYPLRVKHAMLVGIFFGMFFEPLFSLGLGGYHYRFDNVPLWLLFGHGFIFALVYRISRKEWVIKRSHSIQITLLCFVIFYSLFWLFWANDWFGFLAANVFICLLYFTKNSRLFFLIMFVIVCYIEQIGTLIGCWDWPDTLLNLPSWLASGNPPSGIALFYLLFNALVFWSYMYLRYPNTRWRYQNMKLRKR